jgi:hypothetical protein
LRLIVSVILFFKRKVILFSILLIVGLAVGFFIDQNAGTNTRYVQEIIIEPKYESTKYIYDFIEELERNFQDDLFLEKLKINPDSIHNLKEIKLTPIIKATDVLDNLQQKYKDKEFFEDVIKTQIEGNELQSEKYRDLYKQHKLTLIFKNKSTENSKMAASILEYIKSNEHYSKLVNFTIEQTKLDLEQNKATLKIVDDYLMSLSANPQKTEQGIVVTTGNNETLVMTAASLLQQKESLIRTMDRQQSILALDSELFSIVNDGGIMLKKRKLVKQMIFTIPIYLIVLVILFYFIKYLSREVDNFIEEEK